MGAQMNPALTKEEWAAKEFRPSYWGVVALGETELSVRCPDNREIFVGEDRAKLAAFCLDGQEFGFTREMIRCLRDLGHYNQSPEDRDLAYSAIENLEALLPLEE